MQDPSPHRTANMLLASRYAIFLSTGLAIVASAVITQA